MKNWRSRKTPKALPVKDGPQSTTCWSISPSLLKMAKMGMSVTWPGTIRQEIVMPKIRSLPGNSKRAKA